MKKTVLIVLTAVLLLASVLLLPQEVRATTEGYYSYSVTDGKATITDVNPSISGDVVIPDTLDGYPVTAIGDYAFKNCSSLTSVTIPDSVTSIGYEAFDGCTGLTEITIPDSVTSIGNYAFYNCTGLTEITIPDSVTSIGENAFCGCSSLLGIWVSKDNAQYSSDEKGFLFDKEKKVLIQAPGGFSGSYVIPNGVRAIHWWAFKNCTGLKEIAIPESLSAVGGHAFAGCDNLTYNTYDNGRYLGNASNPYVYLVEATSQTISSAIIHPDTKLIGTSAFYNCSGLRSITIPEGVTSISDAAFFGCTGLTTVNFNAIDCGIGWFEPSSFVKDCPNLTTVNFGENVTKIPSNVIWGCGSLTSVTIPDSVISIGEAAFGGCTGLTTVYYTGTEEQKTSMSISDYNDPLLNATWLCSDTREVVLECLTFTLNEDGESYSVTDCDESFVGALEIPVTCNGKPVTSINFGAFECCTGLTRIVIPDSVTNIRDCAFSGCTSLTAVEIPDSVTSIGWGAFGSCSALIYNSYDNGKYLGNESNPYLYLASVTSETITSVTIHTDTKLIGGSAFSGCSGLTEITIPDSVISIGEHAFSGCPGLTSVTFGNGVTEINYGAFSGCTGLSSIELPDGLTTIGSYAFSGCTSLTAVEIPDNVTSIGEVAFLDCNLTYNTYDNANYLGNAENPYVVLVAATAEDITSCTINDRTKIIDGLAFYNCTSLTSITIPNGVTQISAGAFENCTGLVTVEIPDSVTEINRFAFACCTGLTTIEIPGSVTAITGGPFTGCTSLTSVIISNGATEIGPGAFSYCTSLTTIEIPDSVTSIGYGAFSGSNSIQQILYAGTQEQWEAIVKEDSNGSLLDATVTFNYVAVLPGDIDGNGEVEDWDGVMMARHLAGWNVEVEVAALDIDGNGEVEDWDGVLLDRYLAGWDVTIG